MSDPKVRIGQIWRDNNPRLAYSRTCKVLKITGNRVFVEWSTLDGHLERVTRRKHVALARFNGKSNGYSLVEDVKR